MVFYGERFRRDDEEDIWEELKRMITNQPTEEEVFLKKKQEQAWIDSVLDKAFPEEPKTQTEGGNLGNSPLGGVKLGKQPLEGFGNATIHGTNSSKKIDGFLDLGKSDDMLKESFAPIEKNKNSNRNAFGGVNNGYEKTQKEPYLRYEDLLSDESDEEREAREVRELKAFNKAWDKANGVERKDAEGVLTGAVADIGEKIINGIEGIKNIPQDLLQKTKNKVFENANKDFDNTKPKTLEEKIVQHGIEKLGRSLFPMASDATRNGMHDMEAAKNQNNVKVYDNLESLEDTKLKDTLKKIGAKDSDKGAIYDVGSRESDTFSNSPELDAYLTKNRANVIAGKPLEDTSLYYDANSEDARSNQKKYDRYATARKITMVNPKVDENGIFTCELVDYSNFEDEPVNSVGTYLNKWGYKMQEKGHYKPHYQIIKIRKKMQR